MLFKCFNCGNKFYSEVTKPEHIIPNCIGGKLKSTSIICSKCNNEYSKIDESISDALKDLTNILNPSRDNNTKSQLPHKFTSRGFNYTREANGKLYACNIDKAMKKENGGLFLKAKIEYSVENNAKENALKPIFKILEKFCKDNNIPESKLLETKESIINMPTSSVDMPLVPYSIDFETNQSIFLALLKIAIEFYIYNRNEYVNILSTIDILKNRNLEQAKHFVQYIYPEMIIPNFGIHHFLYLKGNQKTGKLYCIISLYNCLNAFILLNDNYTDASFSNVYYYDLFTNKTIDDYKINDNLTAQNVEDIINKHVNYASQMRSKIDQFMLLNKCNEISNIAYRLSEEVIYTLANRRPLFTEQEFRKKFASLFNLKFKSISYVPNMFKTNIEMGKITSKCVQYQSYIDTKVMCTLSSIMGTVISTTIFSNNYKIQPKEYFYNEIINAIASLKKENPKIYDLINDKKYNNDQNIKDFIDSVYPELENKIKNYIPMVPFGSA